MTNSDKKFEHEAMQEMMTGEDAPLDAEENQLYELAKSMNGSMALEGKGIPDKELRELVRQNVARSRGISAVFTPPEHQGTGFGMTPEQWRRFTDLRRRMQEAKLDAISRYRPPMDAASVTRRSSGDRVVEMFGRTVPYLFEQTDILLYEEIQVGRKTRVAIDPQAPAGDQFFVTGVLVDWTETHAFILMTLG